MIVGIVRAREPLIRLTIRGFRGRQQEIEAVVDSGYRGWLTLPPTAIAALNLRWRTFGRGMLADGSVSACVFSAKTAIVACFSFLPWYRRFQNPVLVGRDHKSKEVGHGP